MLDGSMQLMPVQPRPENTQFSAENYRLQMHYTPATTQDEPKPTNTVDIEQLRSDRATDILTRIKAFLEG